MNSLKPTKKEEKNKRIYKKTNTQWNFIDFQTLYQNWFSFSWSIVALGVIGSFDWISHSRSTVMMWVTFGLLYDIWTDINKTHWERIFYCTFHPFVDKLYDARWNRYRSINIWMYTVPSFVDIRMYIVHVVVECV